MNLRRLGARTPLLDHAGEVIGHYDREKAAALMQRPDVMVQGGRRKVTALRFVGPDPSGLALSGSHHRRPAGTPHRHENYYNPAGVWHIDRIPAGWRTYFQPVAVHA